MPAAAMCASRKRHSQGARTLNAMQDTWYHRSAHNEHRARCVIHYLVRRGAEEPAPDSRMAAVADDQQVGADLQGIVWQDLAGMPHTHLPVRYESRSRDSLRGFALELAKKFPPLAARH